jgi:uncharacterized protein
MKIVRMIGRTLACAAMVGLAACHSSTTRIYGINSSTPTVGRIETYRAPPLRVDTLNVPAGWDRIELLSASGAGTLQILDFDHWSAPLAQIARQALSDDLEQRLPSGSVVYPRLPKPSGALGVNVDILEFGVTGSQASMRASWLIVPASGLQNAKRSAALLRCGGISSEPAAVAHAWSELIGQLADRIAADAATFTAP